MPRSHLIGMLLGVEEDWPAAFEALLGRADLAVREGGETHHFSTERVSIEPFDLRMKPRHSLVIDRLGWWYPMPREWLKKVVLMDHVHLLNNPFTFQAMEKHAAYCAMIRLGLKVPETWMLPNKTPPDNPRFAGTAQRYIRYFDLEAVARAVGMPLYMKPFDGGAWVGVSRIENAETLYRAYDKSEQRLMHLQASVDGYDSFARSLGIGAESIVLHFHPEKPMHDRYSVDHNFLTPRAGDEVLTILRTVNAFFRWELNSCETLIRGDDVYPIDYANATPDLALTSLHYYFPWAIRSLLKWVVFCCVTAVCRPSTSTPRSITRSLIAPTSATTRSSPDTGSSPTSSSTSTDIGSSASVTSAHIDELSVAWVESPDFDRIIVDTVRNTFPPHEHEQFIAHFRGLLGAWAHDQRVAAA